MQELKTIQDVINIVNNALVDRDDASLTDLNDAIAEINDWEGSYGDGDAPDYRRDATKLLSNTFDIIEVYIGEIR